MICGYARVSTKLQEREGNSLEAQEQQFKAAGARIVFTESFTGATLDRPQLNVLRKALEAGDTLMITKLDRLAMFIVKYNYLLPKSTCKKHFYR